MRDQDIERRDFEDPPPPACPRMTDEQADEDEDADLEADETIGKWEKELRRAS